MLVESYLKKTRVTDPVPNPFTRKIISFSPCPRIITKEAALGNLHKSGYDIEKACSLMKGKSWVNAVLPNITTPWTAIDVVKFELAMKMSSKKFKTFLCKVKRWHFYSYTLS